MDDSALSLVLFSGTDDRLDAAAVLAAGAASLGRRVDILLQYWALDAFRSDRIAEPHGLAPEAGPGGADAYRRQGEHWSDILRQAKEVGEVGIRACSRSMQMLGLSEADLDPLVDGQHGIASFVMNADGPVTFI